jgi:hypothetical protein
LRAAKIEPSSESHCTGCGARIVPKRCSTNCQEFRAGLGMMGAKEPNHAATQRASYS